MKEKLPVILDVDTGIDDAVAIVMATGQKNLDVKLITCCYGNAPENEVIKNTITVLEQIKKEHIPVVGGNRGKDFMFDKQHIRAHGINGLGGYKKDIHTKPIKTPCSKAMHDIVCQNELTYIIACSPYLNIAEYIKTYPEDINKFKLIAVTGTPYPNKKEPYLNFNISFDMASFQYVLEHVPNIIFCTSDMGHKAYIPSEHFIKSAQYGETGKFLSMLYPSHKDRTVKNGSALHDACGVAWLAKPNMFKMAYAKASIQHADNGTAFLDFDYSAKDPNAVVCIDINKRKFHKWYYNTLKSIK